MSENNPKDVQYENIVSGAKISGTVYNKLNKKMKVKYVKSHTSKASKKATAPKEAK